MKKIFIITNEVECRPEIDYICRLYTSILDAVFQARYEQKYNTSSNDDEICISYSRNDIFQRSNECKIQIKPDNIFWKEYLSGKCAEVKLVKYEDVTYFHTNDWKSKFVKDSNKVITNLDFISSAFYLITRIEEIFTSCERDDYGRFRFCNSIIKNDMIRLPLINMYAKKISNWIKNTYGQTIQFREKRPVALITYDIDAPYYYNKFMKEVSEIIESLQYAGKYRNFDDIMRYILYLIKQRPDPYDVFNYIENEKKKRKIRATYFYITKDNWGLKKKRYLKQLRLLRSSGNEIALHTIRSNGRSGYNAQQQYEEFFKNLEINAQGARYHFLVMKIPETYWNLYDCGIKYDSSLGYAEQEGFRAGICTPFKPFDVLKRQEIDIIEIPLIIMDNTLINYKKITSEKGFEVILDVIDNVYSVNGSIVLLWHNHLLIEKFREWRTVFKKSLDYLIDKNFEFLTCSEIAKKYRRYLEIS